MIKAKYHDGITSDSYEAHIELWQDRIYITAPGKIAEWKYSKTFVTRKATRQYSGSFGNEDAPEAELIIEDRKEFERIAQKLLLQKKQPVIFKIALYIISIALLLFAIFQIIPALVPALGDRMPQNWEERLGSFTRNSFAANYKTCNNPKGQQALDKMVATLAAKTGSKYKFRAEVLNSEKSNAFAAPAGYMMIFSGLIDEAKDQSELAGVLAHEMGHAVKRHGVDHMIRALLTSFVIDALTGGGGTALYLGSEALMLDYSRDAEIDADKYGLQLLDKTNISPAGLAEFFARLEKEEKMGFSKYTKDYDLAFLSTHPSTAQRVQYIKKAIDPNRTYSNPLTLQEWEDLKHICE